jgi:hypothetical protein
MLYANLASSYDFRSFDYDDSKNESSALEDKLELLIAGTVVSPSSVPIAESGMSLDEALIDTGEVWADFLA